MLLEAFGVIVERAQNVTKRSDFSEGAFHCGSEDCDFVTWNDVTRTPMTVKDINLTNNDYLI